MRAKVVAAAAQAACKITTLVITVLMYNTLSYLCHTISSQASRVALSHKLAPDKMLAARSIYMK